MDNTEDNAKEELIAIELAKKDFYFFCRYMFNKIKKQQWMRAAHHEQICDALMRVYRGESKNLIINIPPRYGKTQIMIFFAAWTYGHNPQSNYIMTSYSTKLAVNNSWQIRQIVCSEEYQKIFPNISIDMTSRAKDNWKTLQNGTFYASGSMSALTGFGAGSVLDGWNGCILVDDPNNATDSRSEVMLRNVTNWFGDTLQSRRNGPQTPLIVIMQRLAEDDLSGFLLNGGNGEHWDHLCLAAIQDNNEPLWEEKHTLASLREMENANSYMFAGQYMQRPAPVGGGLFKPAQLQWLDAIPVENIVWYRGYDLASTTTGDYTAGVKLGRRPNGRFIIADVMRVRAGPDERDLAIRNTAAMDGTRVKISIPQDPGQAGKTQAMYMTRDLAGYSVTTSPESGDKVTRAEPIAAQINVGNVDILTGAWNKDFINELTIFPNGKNDDQIDGLSRAFSHLIAPSRVVVSAETLVRFRNRGATRR